MIQAVRLCIGGAIVVSFAFACTPSTDSELQEQSSAGLARREIDRDPPPPKPVKPPVKPPLFTAPSNELAVATWCEPIRYDLRRLARSCEALPGAAVTDGVTYIPGASGRFKVERPLAGGSAPASLIDKTCAYIWEPQVCGSVPDLSVLLVEEPTEQLIPRAPGCEQLAPGGCQIKSPLPEADGGKPAGVGRCEVCGFAAESHLWAVLPDYWTSFSYWAGGQRQVVQRDPSQSFYDVALGTSVAAQDVTIYQFNSAPE